MIKLIETNIEFWILIIFFLSAIIFCILIMVISSLLGGRSKSYYKDFAFESGIIPFGDSRIRFYNQFHLTAIYFVIFDVESIYLYSWCIDVRENGWIGFIEIVFFIMFLLLSLAYIIKSRTLILVPKSKLPNNKR